MTPGPRRERESGFVGEDCAAIVGRRRVEV